MEQVELIKIFALIGLMLAVIVAVGIIRMSFCKILDGFKSLTSATFYLACFFAADIIFIEISLKILPGVIAAFLITITLILIWVISFDDSNEESSNEVKGLWLWFKNRILFLKSKLSEQQILKEVKAFSILSRFFIPIFFITLLIIGAGLAYFLFIVKVLPVFPVIYLLLIVLILWIFAQFLELLLYSSHIIIIMIFIIKNKIGNKISV